MPKAHLYTDGKYRVDLRIQFRMTAYDLASVLAADEAGASELPDLTVREIRDRIQRRLHDQGSDSGMDWYADLDTDEKDALWAWAQTCVARAYPGLDRPTA